MALSLKESQAIADMAQLLYDFLPGSGNRNWKGHVSFKTVAEEVGVGGFWQPGSKLPMITALLAKTLEYRRDHFEQLALGIVRAGLTYRGKDHPIQPNEIERLNGYLLDVGFKFPDLWDPSFTGSLGLDSTERAKRRVDEAIAERQSHAAEQSSLSTDLRVIQGEFFSLHNEASPQAAGLKFERVLNRLFDVCGLAPRKSFRVVGEQIDGSFDLDHETYLFEAKWEKNPISEAPLLVFREKIAGKSQFSRGVFVSLNGITVGAQDAITRGKQPNFFVVDGYDLTMVLSEQIGLPELLRQKRRLLADEGKVVALFSEVRGIALSPS